MDIGSLLLILALLVAVILFIGRPLLDRKAYAVQTSSALEDHELSSLLAERDRVLMALQELDFDNALGKIPAEDYPDQRAALITQGSLILRQIDEIQPTESDASAEARLETAIAARRADAVVLSATGASVAGNGHRAVPPDDELETLIANRKRTRTEKATGFCPQCGSPLQQADRFCSKCGYKIA
jgi:Mg-chelatase subunit ChlI